MDRQREGGDPARVGSSGRGGEHPFILGHGILWDETDKDIAVELIQNVQAQFPEFKLTCSFDRSFYSPPVRKELDPILETTAMSAKGKLSQAEQARQNTPAYKGHSAVESCMNHLNHRRMNIVREMSQDAFARAIALSVLGANLHRLGTLIQAQERKRQRLRRAAQAKRELREF